jgi:hypothetical protein
MRVCGFCNTGHHHNCKKEIKYYEKIWVCECSHGENNESDKSEDTDDSGTEPRPIG